MKILVERKWQNSLATTGEIFVINNDKEILFKSYILENPKIGSARGQDLAIPFGVYQIDRYYSPKFNPTLEQMQGLKGEKMMRLSNDSLNVPKSACVLIHWGNDETHTLGCPLLGYEINKEKSKISFSRAACKVFYQFFKGNQMQGIEYEIIDKINKD